MKNAIKTHIKTYIQRAAFLKQECTLGVFYIFIYFYIFFICFYICFLYFLYSFCMHV